MAFFIDRCKLVIPLEAIFLNCLNYTSIRLMCTSVNARLRCNFVF